MQLATWAKTRPDSQDNPRWPARCPAHWSEAPENRESVRSWHCLHPTAAATSEVQALPQEHRQLQQSIGQATNRTNLGPYTYPHNTPRYKVVTKLEIESPKSSQF